MERSIENINRILPVMNMVAIFVFILFVVWYIYHREKLNINQMLSQRDDTITILVINENLTGNLKNKNIDVISLSPLKIKIKDSDIYIQKEGEWVKVQKNAVILIFKPQEPYVVEGVKPYSQ